MNRKLELTVLPVREHLHEKGYKEVVNMTGGLNEWSNFDLLIGS